MQKHDPKNERTKRSYARHLKHAQGKDNKTIEKEMANIALFEQSNGYKPFSSFHIDHAIRFKEKLAVRKNKRTGKTLAHSTVDATLRSLKAFFRWLAGQPGYKSRIRYSDCEYFNNNRKQARIAHTARTEEFPSMDQCLAAFRAMPKETPIEKRNKAMFAFLMLTGVRVGALHTLRLKHISIEDRHVFQDAREVGTKNAKTIDTWFYPVHHEFLNTFTKYCRWLAKDLLFGPSDPLFPKPKIGQSAKRCFEVQGLSRDMYRSDQALRQAFKNAFLSVQMPTYTPHDTRKTLTLYGSEMCKDPRSFKAWSLNMGHESVATTVNSYLPVSRDTQRDLVLNLSNKKPL